MGNWQFLRSEWHTKNFWSAFTLDLSLLMWSFWKISMHRQWINYFERDTWIILFSVVLKDVKIIFFLYNPTAEIYEPRLSVWNKKKINVENDMSRRCSKKANEFDRKIE